MLQITKFIHGETRQHLGEETVREIYLMILTPFMSSKDWLINAFLACPSAGDIPSADQIPSAGHIPSARHFPSAGYIPIHIP